MRRLRYMRVLGKETERLLSTRSLAIVAVLAVVFFFVFMEYYIDFSHAHSQYEDYKIAQRMLTEYGYELDADEFEDFKTWIDDYEAECERWIVGNPIFESVGVYSYSDYEALYHRGHAAEETKEENRAIWALLGEECDYARFYVQAHEEIVQKYELAQKIVSDSDLLSHIDDERRLEKELDLHASGEYMSMFSAAVTDNTEQYLSYLAILCMLSAMFIAAPSAVTDRVTGVDNIQRSTRHGRYTAVTRLGGAVSASIAVAAVEIVLATIILFASSGCGVFWNCRIDSFMSYALCFDEVTFGQHYMGSVLLILALCASASLLTCVISSLSRSMVSVILKLVPMFIVFAVVCNYAIYERGMFTNAIYRFTGIPFAPLLCVLLLLAVAVAACCLHVHSELKKDA